ncbi:hypothetical protein BDW69DRAFT_177200 [Aspergillus filifer]
MSNLRFRECSSKRSHYGLSSPFRGVLRLRGVGFAPARRARHYRTHLRGPADNPKYTQWSAGSSITTELVMRMPLLGTFLPGATFFSHYYTKSDPYRRISFATLIRVSLPASIRMIPRCSTAVQPDPADYGIACIWRNG